MDTTNWDLIRFQYEVLGTSLTQLAQEHGLGLPMLEFAAKEWKPIPLAQQKALQFPDISSLEEISKEMVNKVREHTRIHSVLKQKFLGPKYIALEVLLLSKAQQVLAEMDVKDKQAANSLRTITAVLKDLLEQNSLLHVSSEREELEDGRQPTSWEVRIVDTTTEIDGPEEA